jgi:hypothetical protein
LGFGKFLKEKMAHHEVQNCISKKFQDLVGHVPRRIHLMNIGLVREGLIQPPDFIKPMSQTFF